MAIVKTIQLDVKSNSKKAEKDFEDLKKDIDEIGKSVQKNLSGQGADRLTKELNKTTQAAVSTKTRLRELEDEMANIGDVGSPQFQKLAAEAGVLRDKMNNAKAAVKSMSADFPRLQLGVQAFNAIGGAAQGAMGAAQLFGSENEAVQEGIQKLVAIQSVLNAVNTVANALSDETALGLKARTVLSNLKNASDTKSLALTTAMAAKQKLLNIAQIAGAAAMKLLNAAMAANPVLLIVTGVAALTGALVYFLSGTEDVTAANDKLNESLDKQNTALELNEEKVRKTAENRRRILELNGASEEELHEDTLKRLKEEEDLRLKQIDNSRQVVSEKQRIYRKALEEEDYDLAKSVRKEIESERNKINKLKLLNKEYNIAVQEENKEFAEKREADRKEAIEKEEADRRETIEKEKADLKQRADNYKRYQQNRLNAIRKIQDLELQLNENEIEANNLKYERLIQDTKKNETFNQEQKQKIIDSYEQLRDRKDRQLQYERAEREKWELIGKEEIKFEIKTAFLDREIQELPPKKLESEKKLSDEEIELERNKQNAKLQMASDALGAISGLITAFAGDNEAAQRKAFNINKGISIAQAIINTAQAVTGALTAGGNPIKLATGAQFVEAGIAAAAGAAQIATISKTKFNSTSTNIDNPGNITPPSVASQSPTFNVVGDTGVNQLAQTLGNAPMKAYVVSGDVTTAQSLERNKIEQSKL